MPRRQRECRDGDGSGKDMETGTSRGGGWQGGTAGNPQSRERSAAGSSSAPRARPDRCPTRRVRALKCLRPNVDNAGEDPPRNTHTEVDADMGAIPGGKPGTPDPREPGRRKSDDGLDDLFDDLVPKPADERVRTPMPAGEAEDPVDGLGDDDEPRGTPREKLEPAVKAASIWLHMFARTLKTCRLYDAGNPTVVRFREELTRTLEQVLAEHGAVTYRFSAADVTCDGQSLYPARSRDDNLAFAFYRDGVRGLTLSPGADARECDALVDSVLNHSDDVEFILDPVVLHRGRAQAPSRLPKGVQGEQAVISF